MGIESLKGILVSLGAKNYGLEMMIFYACPDCGTDYPVIGNAIRCNGQKIKVCPYCHPKGNSKARGDHLTGRKEKRP